MFVRFAALLFNFCLFIAFNRASSRSEKKLSILIATGGNDCSSNINDHCPRDVEFFSSDDKSFHKNGSQATAYSVANFGSVMVNGTIYRIGGKTADGNVIDSVWAYNVTSDTWEDLVGFPEIVEFSSVVELNGTMIVLGGGYDAKYDGTLVPLMDVYTYNLAFPDKYRNKWQKLPTALPAYGNNFSSCAVVADETSIFFVTDTGDLYRTDDGALNWTKLASMETPRMLPVCAALPGNQEILVAGGITNNDTILSTAEIYDIRSNTWKAQGALMQKPRYAAAAAVLPDNGNVVMCGGLTYNVTGTGHIPIAGCEILDVTTNQWHITDFAMHEARSGFGLFVRQVEA